MVFVIAFIAFDKIFILVRNASPALEVDKRLEMIITGKIHADVVFMGSSRGARSMIATQFTDSTGISAYNLSFPGSDITFHEFALEQLLKTEGNTKPKTVVLVVDDSDELKTSKNLKFRLDRMYPLVKYKVIRKKMVQKKEKKPVINELLVLHQLNKSNFLFKQRKFTKNDSIMKCGSMPISHQKKTFNKQFRSKASKYSTQGELIQKVRAFRSFVDMCKENNIQLIIAIPPNFSAVSIGFPERMEQMVKGHGTVWMYDQNDPIYRNPEYFFDNAHLQTIGSEYYTAQFIEYYKELNKIK